MSDSSTERLTGVMYLAQKHRISQEEVRATFAKETLLGLGRTAARIAAARKLQAIRVRDAVLGLYVHTWPVEVWEAAASGEKAPARPASQRQVVYLAFLAVGRYGLEDGKDRLFSILDNEMDEDRAAELIKQLGGA